MNYNELESYTYNGLEVFTYNDLETEFIVESLSIADSLSFEQTVSLLESLSIADSLSFEQTVSLLESFPIVDSWNIIDYPPSYISGVTLNCVYTIDEVILYAGR